jgi:hypothetical protein
MAIGDHPGAGKYRALKGFDVDHTGIDCADLIEWDEPRDVCPFTPGCGKKVSDCPLQIQRAMICEPPKRAQ